VFFRALPAAKLDSLRCTCLLRVSATPESAGLKRRCTTAVSNLFKTAIVEDRSFAFDDGKFFVTHAYWTTTVMACYIPNAGTRCHRIESTYGHLVPGCHQVSTDMSVPCLTRTGGLRPSFTHLKIL
jgi:hypothetical protein